MIKAAILDFDGTLVTKDILDVVCGIVGKQEESRKINKEFHAGIRPADLSPLIERINFLKGVTMTQIEKKLSENSYLMSGAKELLDYLHSKKIVSILSSGNILPVLHYYQKILGFNYIVGSKPRMDGETILGISREDFKDPDFKLTEAKVILERLHITPNETVAIGDSPADKKIFEFVNLSIAINPIEGIEKSVDYVIKDNLRNAIPVIENSY